MKKIAAFILFYLLLTFAITGQQGAWEPPEGDYSRPRTLLKANQVEYVKSILSEEIILPLYLNVYSRAKTTVPTGSSNSARFGKARIAKACAFVVLLEKKYENGIIIDLPASEKEEYINKAIDIMETIETSVDRITVLNLSAYDSWQWRSRELIDLMSAYDLLLGAGISQAVLAGVKSNLQQFAGNLHEEATRAILPPFFNSTFFDLVKNNHAIMTASALAFSAVAMNDAVSSDGNLQSASWISAGMWNLDNCFFRDEGRMSDPGVVAGYTEGSLYFRYSLSRALPLVRAYGNFLPDVPKNYQYEGNERFIKNPWFDDDWKNLYAWINQIRLPDGKIPPIEDTHMNDSFPELMLLEGSEYFWLDDYTDFDVHNQLLSQTARYADLVANFIAAYAPPEDPAGELFTVLPEAGSAVFRSSWETDAVYMHITAKNGHIRENALGHNQADVSSFLIHAYGRTIALDPGYISWDRREEVGNAQNHSMILVDGMGPAIGDILSGNDADGFIEDKIDKKNLDYLKVKTAYEGAAIERHFNFVRNKYFVIGDYISSDAPHEYTFQLHGYGREGGDPEVEGSFSSSYSEKRASWERKGVKLEAVVLTAGGNGTYYNINSPHEYSFDTSAIHTAMYIDTPLQQNGAFLSILFPSNGGEYEINIKRDDNIPVFNCIMDGRKDIIFLKENNGTEIIFDEPGDKKIKSGAKMGFLGFQEDNFEYVSLSESDSLFIDDQLWFASDIPVNFTLESESDGTLTGYISKSSTVVIYTGFGNNLVTGENISGYTNLSSGLLEIEFSDESYFSIEAAGGGGSLSVTYPAGWNIISVPLESVDMSAVNIFPEASSDIYRYSNGYFPSDSLEGGAGYWVKFSEAVQKNYSGGTFSGNISISEGWNLVGPFDYVVETAAVTTSPGDILLTPFFSYENGYGNTAELNPGKAYWVKSSEEGELILNQETQTAIEKEINFVPDMEILSITDNKGRIYKLFISAEKISDERYSLPPPPPGDSPDVRFSGNKSLFSGSDFKGEILLRGIEFPIGLNLTGGKLKIELQNSVKNRGCILSPENPQVLTRGRIFVEHFDSAPEKFEVSQNYPNPFNSATNLNFVMPEEGEVKITVYNISGERILRNKLGILKRGSHTAKIDGGNIASGVYFYSVSAKFPENRILKKVRKMIYIK